MVNYRLHAKRLVIGATLLAAAISFGFAFGTAIDFAIENFGRETMAYALFTVLGIAVTYWLGALFQEIHPGSGEGGEEVAD